MVKSTIDTYDNYLDYYCDNAHNIETVCNVTITNDIFTKTTIYIESTIATKLLKCVACNITQIDSNKGLKFNLKGSSYNVDFSNCHIQSIFVNGLNNFNKQEIKMLNLSHNEIRIFNEPGVFSTLIDFHKLDLSYNLLTTIHSDAFSGIASLETLFLNDNEISNLDPLLFFHSPKLRKLFLHNNQILTISNNLFEIPSELHQLTLNNNKIMQFNGSIIQNLTNLQHINLSNNQFTNEQIIYANKKQFLCSNASINELHIDDNVIELDASYNQLNSLKLSEAVNVKHLNLSNNYLSDINFTEWNNIHTLNLASNKLIHIDFHNLKNVTHVNLSRNKLVSFSYTCNKLQEIDFSDNLLDSFKSATDCQHLTFMNFSRNNLNDCKFLKIRKNLEILDFSFNKLVFISFTNTPNLIELYLSHNLISNIPQTTSLKRLTKLDLSSNKIATIDSITFENLIKLKWLNLKNNALLSITVGTFKSLHNLEYLNIAYNGITNINAKALLPLENLIELHIDGNYIEEIESINVFEHLKWFRLIYLNDNAWKCSALKSMIDYFNGRKVKIDSNALTSNNNCKNDTNNTLAKQESVLVTDVTDIILKNLTEIYSEIEKHKSAIANVTVSTNTTITDLFSKLIELRQNETNSNQLNGSAHFHWLQNEIVNIVADGFKDMNGTLSGHQEQYSQLEHQLTNLKETLRNKSENIEMEKFHNDLGVIKVISIVGIVLIAVAVVFVVYVNYRKIFTLNNNSFNKDEPTIYYDNL